MHPHTASTWHSSVAADPIGMVAAPLVAIMLVFLPKRCGPVLHESRVSLKRRFTAFVIDLYVALIIFAPLPTLAGLALEAFATGTWAWSFERDFFRWTDIFFMLLFFSIFVGIVYFFGWHFRHQRQTPGQWLLGFKLLPAGQNPSIMKRAFIAWRDMAWWFRWHKTLLPKRQDYGWDIGSDIVARRVERQR